MIPPLNPFILLGLVCAGIGLIQEALSDDEPEVLPPKVKKPKVKTPPVVVNVNEKPTEPSALPIVSSDG